MKRSVKIYDTTLRDGSQGEDISFSLADKLRIAKKLDELGIHYVEAGWPGTNPKDTAFFKEIKKLEIKQAAIVAFGSTRRKQVPPGRDPQVKALVDSGARTIAIVGKTWDFHVVEVLAATLAENLAMISDTVDFLKNRGREVIFDAEHFFDAWSGNQTYAEECVLAAARAGADVICLCDTNGGGLPARIAAGVDRAKQLVPVPLGIHCHNDGELAVANSLAAVERGAAMVQGVINGFGERSGNANLCSILPNLMLKMGVSAIPAAKLKRLREVSHFIYEAALIAPPNHQPYVGDSAFAHKGGQHGDAVRKDPRAYEHVTPESVGNRRRFIISDLAGGASIAAKREEFGYAGHGNDPHTRELLEQVKNLEDQGYQFEGAEASFELLMHEALGSRRRFFEFKGFRVIDEKRPDDPTARAEATIMVEAMIDGNRILTHTAAAGVGPVNALDNAVRKALLHYYPRLKEMRLIDFKVRVLPAGLATASKVRVTIESTDGADVWGTVGVSENIIEASWRALIDSIDYKLYKDERSTRKKGRRKKP